MDLSSLSEEVIHNIETWKMKFWIYKQKKYFILPILWWAEVFTEINDVDDIVARYNIQNYFNH